MSGEGKLASRPIYQGRIVDLSVDTVRFPDGTRSELEMIRHSGAAAVVALQGPADARDPQVLLVRQYRYAADGYILEIPAGRPSRAGEPWDECAARELAEETGFRPATLQHLTSIYTTPGFTDERIHIFLATGLTPGATARDPDEFIEVQPVPLSAALQLVRSGDITDAKSICGLAYAALFVMGNR